MSPDDLLTIRHITHIQSNVKIPESVPTDWGNRFRPNTSSVWASWPAWPCPASGREGRRPAGPSPGGRRHSEAATSAGRTWQTTTRGLHPAAATLLCHISWHRDTELTSILTKVNIGDSRSWTSLSSSVSMSTVTSCSPMAVMMSPAWE